MTDPITSEYDEDPIDPDKGDGNEDPPDLGNTDSPELTVWDDRPSFDTAPKDIDPDKGGEEPPDAPPSSKDFSVDLDNLATQIDAMLTTSRSLVTRYENLRTKVLNSQATVFGQESTEESNGTFDTSTGSYYGEDETEPDDPSPRQESAKKFAEQMNPAQKKALQHIGGVLELVGEYIALANHSGQVYAEADRNSTFPPPPSNTVTG